MFRGYGSELQIKKGLAICEAFFMNELKSYFAE